MDERIGMTHVITETCIGAKHADCVEVCPVDCIHEADKMFYIDPDECIDCGSCVSQCPVDAIFTEADVPAKWTNFIGANAALAKGEKVDVTKLVVAQTTEGPKSGAEAAATKKAGAGADVPETEGFSPRSPVSPLTLKRLRELQPKK